jgi:glycosyltransferase involved in cell wall biosynthesis
MHVGVFLDENIRPVAGGGYTFVHDIVTAFIRHADESQHQFTLFCPPSFAASVKGTLPQNVTAVGMAKRGFAGRAVSELRHASSLFAIVWRWPCRLERLARSRRVDLMWFVGGAYDTLDLPYFTTVWDLQHRTHPWFPEVSNGGVWDHREVFFRRHLGRAAKVITGTKIGCDQLARFYGIPDERICVLPHPTPGFALNASAYQDRTSKDMPKDFFFYPAQLWPHKNHVNLLKGYSLLKERRPSTPPLVFSGGDSGNLTVVKSVVTRLGLTHSVIFLGFVTVEELIGLYRNARALVYASFSGPENLPPLEAFAIGCPVAAAKVPGAVEQLEDAALFFDPADPNGIADALNRLVEDEHLRSSLIERGRRRALRWTGTEFVRAVFSALDEFAPICASWRG